MKTQSMFYATIYVLPCKARWLPEKGTPTDTDPGQYAVANTSTEFMPL